MKLQFSFNWINFECLIILTYNGTGVERERERFPLFNSIPLPFSSTLPLPLYCTANKAHKRHKSLKRETLENSFCTLPFFLFCFSFAFLFLFATFSEFFFRVFFFTRRGGISWTQRKNSLSLCLSFTRSLSPFGFVLLLGVCCWNRTTHKIHISRT